jgi:hypothetical protein
MKRQIIHNDKNEFKVPKGYFDGLEDSILSKLTEQHLPDKDGFSVPECYFDILEDSILSKLTEQLPKKDGLDIPENYFDTLEDRIFEKLNLSDKPIKKSKLIIFKEHYSKQIIQFTVAASLLLISSLVYLNFKGDATSFNQLAYTDIENWVDNNIDNIDSETITEVYSDEDINLEVNYEEEDLINYLEEKDIESIVNELDSNY